MGWFQMSFDFSEFTGKIGISTSLFGWARHYSDSMCNINSEFSVAGTIRWWQFWTWCGQWFLLWASQALHSWRKTIYYQCFSNHFNRYQKWVEFCWNDEIFTNYFFTRFSVIVFFWCVILALYRRMRYCTEVSDTTATVENGIDSKACA